MAHHFDRSGKDPYVEAARHIEATMFTSEVDYQRGAQEEIYDSLSNAIVDSLGDIAAQAYRLGVNSPEQIKGLAKAVAESSPTTFSAYHGEIDPEPALRAIESDDRWTSLSEENQLKLRAEIEKTRQLEHLLLTGKRLPELLDFAGSLGLHFDEDTLEHGTLLVGEHPTPTAGEVQT